MSDVHIFQRAIHRETRHIHDQAVLLVLDLNRGVDSIELQNRLDCIIGAVLQLQSELRSLEESGLTVRIIDHELKNRACQKCLLQSGEQRNLG